MLNIVFFRRSLGPIKNRKSGQNVPPSWILELILELWGDFDVPNSMGTLPGPGNRIFHYFLIDKKNIENQIFFPPPLAPHGWQFHFVLASREGILNIYPFF